MKLRLPTLLAIFSCLVLVTGAVSTGRGGRFEVSQAQPTNDIAFETSQTAKLLGVSLQSFPAPQALKGFDEIPRKARLFKYTLTPQRVSGSPPRVSYHERETVTARGSDGSVFEAYCGSDDPEVIIPGHGFVSSFENRRQWYGTHHGYGYMPQNVFIGRPEGTRIKPTLFFRDVGSHTTAPHYIAVDSQGMVHLVVADVNIYQENRLDLYWVIGDPKRGKWNAAWLIDRRGFTSWSHPWIAAWDNKVHAIWDWCDVSIHKNAPGMGAFHVEWSPNGFGRKTRIFTSPVGEYGAAFDPQSGLLVIVVARDGGGVYGLSRTLQGKWTRPAFMIPKVSGLDGISIEATGNGAFTVRAGADETKEWLLRPNQ